jgi:hypothetical protein
MSIFLNILALVYGRGLDYRLEPDFRNRIHIKSQNEAMLTKRKLISYTKEQTLITAVHTASSPSQPAAQ